MRNHYATSVGPFLFALFLLTVKTPAVASGIACTTDPCASRQETGSLVRNGSKLSFGEKLTLKILQKKWEKKARKNKMRANGLFKGANEKTDDARHNSVSLIFGILSVILVFISWSGSGFALLFLIFALILSIAGLAMGIKGLRKDYPKRNLAVAGTVVSGIGLGMVVLTGALILLLFLAFG